MAKKDRCHLRRSNGFADVHELFSRVFCPSVAYTRAHQTEVCFRRELRSPILILHPSVVSAPR